MRECEVADCPSPIVGQGLCRKHYMRMRRKGRTDDARKNARGSCSIDGCERRHYAFGLCVSHRQAERRKEKTLKGRLADPRTCGHCGGPVDPNRRRRGPTSYCSRPCKDKAFIAAGGNRAASLKAYYKRKYDLTQEQVTAMLDAQGGGCAICGERNPKGKHSGFHVDHCHKTGRVRGILCHGCNVSLGHFKDDPALLRRAAEYVTEHSVDYTP